MDLYTFLDELRAYTDEFGFIHDTTAKDSGDCVIITAYAVMAVMLLPGARARKEEFARQVIRAIDSIRIEPGLFRRHPVHYRDDQVSHDLYTGLFAISAMLDLRLSREIYTLAKKSFWYLPTYPPYQKHFHIRAWLGRHLMLVAFGKRVSRASWNVIDYLAFHLGTLFAAQKRRDNYDAWLIQYLMLHALNENNEHWKHAFDRHFKSFGQCFSEYCKDHNHPIGRAIV